MQRRHFLKLGALAPLLSLKSNLLQAETTMSLAPPAKLDETWREYEISLEVHPIADEGAVQVWLPMPAENLSNMQTISKQSTWEVSAGGSAQLLTLAPYQVPVLSVKWPSESRERFIKVNNYIKTRDVHIDLEKPISSLQLSEAEKNLYLRATKYLPTGNEVKKVIDRILTGKEHTAIDKVRAIYEWVVDNTSRNPKTQGCGTGNVEQMLTSGQLNGKCADINGLFVALCRAAGVPARDIYGIRIDDSRLGYKSLGKYGDISKAQHCRAEFFAEGFGWIPADPADVRKVILEEEPGGLTTIDPKVQAARKLLFGAWEMNWMAYNVGHDLLLPGLDHDIPYLMYPNGLTEKGMLDSLDPSKFRYQILSKRL